MPPVSNSANKQTLWAGLFTKTFPSQHLTACGSPPPEMREKRTISALAAASVAICTILGCHKDFNFHEETEKSKEPPNRWPRSFSMCRARSRLGSESYTTKILTAGFRLEMEDDVRLAETGALPSEGLRMKSSLKWAGPGRSGRFNEERLNDIPRFDCWPSFIISSDCLM